MTPYGNIDLDQHWPGLYLVAWWHQAITWTNVDLSSVRPSSIHRGVTSRAVPELPLTTISLKITHLKYHWNLPGPHELTHLGLELHICPMKNNSTSPSFIYMCSKPIHFSYSLRQDQSNSAGPWWVKTASISAHAKFWISERESRLSS